MAEAVHLGTVDDTCGEQMWRVDRLMDENRLTGTMPTELGASTALRYLYMDTNSLTGTVPTELGASTALTYLHCHTNSLTGTVPTELGALTSLANLYMHTNSLRGTVPTELGALTALANLHGGEASEEEAAGWAVGCMKQQRSGEYWRSQARGSTRDLEINRLTGAVPTELGASTALTYLKLQKNSLAGAVPTEIGGMKALIFVSTHENSLSSTLPTEFGRITTLTNMMIYDNSFTGTLPTELESLTALTAMTLIDNPGLCGEVPSTLEDVISSTSGTGLGADCPTGNNAREGDFHFCGPTAILNAAGFSDEELQGNRSVCAGKGEELPAFIYPEHDTESARRASRRTVWRALLTIAATFMIRPALRWAWMHLPFLNSAGVFKLFCFPRGELTAMLLLMPSIAQGAAFSLSTGALDAVIPALVCIVLLHTVLVFGFYTIHYSLLGAQLPMACYMVLQTDGGEGDFLLREQRHEFLIAAWLNEGRGIWLSPAKWTMRIRPNPIFSASKAAAERSVRRERTVKGAVAEASCEEEDTETQGEGPQRSQVGGSRTASRSASDLTQFYIATFRKGEKQEIEKEVDGIEKAQPMPAGIMTVRGGFVARYGIFFDNLRGDPVDFEEGVRRCIPYKEAKHMTKFKRVSSMWTWNEVPENNLENENAAPPRPWRLYYNLWDWAITMYFALLLGIFAVPCACETGDDQPLMCTWPQTLLLTALFSIKLAFLVVFQPLHNRVVKWAELITVACNLLIIGSVQLTWWSHAFRDWVIHHDTFLVTLQIFSMAVKMASQSWNLLVVLCLRLYVGRRGRRAQKAAEEIKDRMLVCFGYILNSLTNLGSLRRGISSKPSEVVSQEALELPMTMIKPTLSGFLSASSPLLGTDIEHVQGLDHDQSIGPSHQVLLNPIFEIGIAKSYPLPLPQRIT
ncbi:hypothetical protein CYMTET_36012 [Cymbomonas tetramitiformis]|uniref:Uncharacterized protein n=1 Tax=Cymbomonas tetramitiformis TaxID=36881 RepID=A0AAE0F827_9CHLO|nr:hypothetical protein CYMTET_36012 [Cymbomonas tetramitiformis]